MKLKNNQNRPFFNQKVPTSCVGCKLYLIYISPSPTMNSRCIIKAIHFNYHVLSYYYRNEGSREYGSFENSKMGK